MDYDKLRNDCGTCANDDTQPTGDSNAQPADDAQTEETTEAPAEGEASKTEENA